MPTPAPASVSCRHCGEANGWAGPVPPGKTFHPDCWHRVRDGLQTIPLIYRKLRPIVPVRGVAGKPFVVILGEAGAGKSVSAGELLEYQAVEHGAMPCWLNVPELMLKIRATFDDKSGSNEEDVINSVVNKRGWLCLDDVGAEKISDYSTSTLYLILNQRGENSRLTVITSNLSLDAIAQKLDDRIASRLARYGHVVTLTKNNVQPTEVPPIGGDAHNKPELARESRI